MNEAWRLILGLVPCVSISISERVGCLEVFEGHGFFWIWVRWEVVVVDEAYVCQKLLGIREVLIQK